MTHPHAETQATLYKKVLEQACTSPQQIGYVEMHGTGTQVGDSIEMESVISVFGEGRCKDNPLVVGAVKANVGHGEAVSTQRSISVLANIHLQAAGVTSFIKTIMMLREDSIPPQPGTPFVINHKYPPLSKMNVQIADRCIPFKPPLGGDGKRRLLLNSFDASVGWTYRIMVSCLLNVHRVETLVWSSKIPHRLRLAKGGILDRITSLSAPPEPSCRCLETNVGYSNSSRLILKQNFQTCHIQPLLAVCIIP